MDAPLSLVAHSAWTMDNRGAEAVSFSVMPDGRRDWIAEWDYEAEALARFFIAPLMLAPIVVSVSGTRCFVGLRLLPFSAGLLGRGCPGGPDGLPAYYRAGLEACLHAQGPGQVGVEMLASCFFDLLASHLAGAPADAIAAFRAALRPPGPAHEPGHQARARSRQRAYRAGEAVPGQALKSLERFERATGQLLAGGTLHEVAFASGYADAAHLSRDIKARTGLTPRELARKLSQTFNTASMYRLDI